MIGLKRGTVKLVKHDLAWKKSFEREARKIRKVFGEDALELEHVGSTAIKGMLSKPIIDMALIVPSLKKTKRYAKNVQAAGYELKKDDTRKERLFFTKGPEKNRTHYLHVGEIGSGYAENMIIFRDYLRSHKDVAKEYSELKVKLAKKHEKKREVHTAKKEKFIKNIINNMKLGKWKKVKTEETYQCGKFYRVDKDKILTPGGKAGAYYVIRKPYDSIIVVPVNKKGMFYLTNQHRYPVNDFSLEFPAGNTDNNETTLKAAKRELEEEMHLASDRWKKLGGFYAANGISDLKFIAYLAKEVYAVAGESKDPIDKNLHQTKKLSFAEIEKKIKKGEISDGPTITSLTLYKLSGK